MKILAPAGTEEAVYAAFDNGADAVYAAPAGWSRRVSQFGLDDAGMLRCIDYANARGKELRVPLNAYFLDEDIPRLLEKVGLYVERGVTGVIAADLALVQEIRRLYPQTKLYVSVAAGVCNTEKALFYKELGACEFVAPYNMTATEMATIHSQAGIDVEAFAHGHFDFNQCGRCWMSGYFQREDFEEKSERTYVIGSVNRGGGCYRVCRAGWDLVDKNEKIVRADDLIEGDRFYFYYGLDQLGDFVRAGVTSLKIMGRSYTTEFVIRITRMYRRLVDEALHDPVNYRPSAAMKEEARQIEAIRSKLWSDRNDLLIGRTPLREARAHAHA